MYVHKKWDIKTLQANEGDDWAKITIGEGVSRRDQVGTGTRPTAITVVM
jgi:hypothetical protein